MTPLFKILRPHQWSKNIFVFAGIIFAHAWQNWLLASQAFIAAIAFSLLASSVYIFNDFFDRKHDREHPIKKHRPLAAKTLRKSWAIILGLILGMVALILGFTLSLNLGWILISYLALNFVYSLLLKKMIIIDVFVIAAGFLLRVLAGTSGIGIPPTHWLLLCTLLLTLFLGFCKRRTEQHFKSLPHYPTALLDKFITITATGSIIAYIFYTLHQNNLIILTVPLVIYGIFRYLYLINRDNMHHTGIDMARDIIHDRQLSIIIFIWLLAIIVLPQIH